MDDGVAVLTHPIEQPRDFFARLRIEVTLRFVSKNDRRIIHPIVQHSAETRGDLLSLLDAVQDSISVTSVPRFQVRNASSKLDSRLAGISTGCVLPTCTTLSFICAMQVTHWVQIATNPRLDCLSIDLRDEVLILHWLAHVPGVGEWLSE